MTQLIDNQQLGNGSLTVPEQVAIARAKQKHLRNCTFSEAPRQIQQAIVFTLLNGWPIKVRTLAAAFNVHPSTIYRIHSDAKFFVKKHKSLQVACDDLRNYILYNAKYLP